MDNHLPIHVFELAPGQHRAGDRGRAPGHRRLDTCRVTPKEAYVDRRLSRRCHPADGQVGGGDARALQLGAHRPRDPGAPRPHRDRLLRHADAAQEPRDDQRARAAHADDPAVRPDVDQADREDDPGVGSRPDAVERRQADPPADPAVDRGAPQGARQGRAADGGGGPRRRAERPTGRDQASRGARQERRASATTTSARPRGASRR